MSPSVQMTIPIFCASLLHRLCHMCVQAISVIVTHRTDDMSKLPPRLPVNAPKPPKAPAPNRPKLRLGQTAKPSEAAADGPAPGPSGQGEGVSVGEVSEGLGEGVGEAKSGGEPAAFASPAKVHPGIVILQQPHESVNTGNALPSNCQQCISHIDNNPKGRGTQGWLCHSFVMALAAPVRLAAGGHTV